MHRVLVAIAWCAAAREETQGSNPFGLRPLGRSFFSTDPTASANFFIKYLNGKAIPQNLTDNKTCADVAAVEYGSGDILVFVLDKVKVAGSIPASMAVESAQGAWREVAVQRQRLYNQWIDFHDGFTPALGFDIDRFIEDNLSAQVYHDSVSVFPDAILRLSLPGTSWTVEVAGKFSLDVAKKMERFRFDNPDYCRNNSVSPPIDGPGFWWKATFASANPYAATEFAVSVLGAEEVQSPYPWPPLHNCTIAKWVLFRDAGFMLHFVKSHEFGAGKLSVDTYATYQDKLRNLSGHIFDQHMYNNLILWSADLDSLVARLNLMSVPFSAYALGDKLFAIYVNIPGNGIVLQIRGSSLTSAKSTPFDPCD